MRVDPAQSAYHESESAKADFNRIELRRCRLLLRRLRYLEHQIKMTGGLANESANGGAAFTEWEVEALEWILTDIGFLPEKVSTRERNSR